MIAPWMTTKKPSTIWKVFNLNTIISAIGRQFAAPRKFLLEKMATENKSGKGFVDWSSRAKDFDQFPLPDKDRRPSNWWLVFYAFYLPIRDAFCFLIYLIIAPLPNTAPVGSVHGDRPEFAGQVWYKQQILGRLQNYTLKMVDIALCISDKLVCRKPSRLSGRWWL